MSDRPIELRAIPRSGVAQAGLILFGPVTGWPYEVTSLRAMARYALESFQWACKHGEASWPTGLHALTVEEVRLQWVPVSVRVGFECLGLRRPLLDAIEGELQRQCHLDCGTGGAAIEPMTYVGGEVDEILVEKALDALVALEGRYVFDPEGYADAVEGEEWPLVDQCMRILHTYGTRLVAEGPRLLVAAFIDWTRSGKYAGVPQARRVVASALNEAWDGLGPWKA